MANNAFLEPPPLTPPRSKTGKYNIFPVFPLDEAEIMYGFQNLASIISAHRNVLLDGFCGILWTAFRKNLLRHLESLDLQVNWLDCRDYLLPEKEITEQLESYLGGTDPLFGRRCPYDLDKFFQKNWDQDIRQRLADNNDVVNIIAGTGSFLSQIDGFRVYIDIPKSVILSRTREGKITNLGVRKPEDSKSMYKRFYFVDWQVLNRQKRRWLPQIDLMVDGQRDELPVFISGNAYRSGLDKMIDNFVRLRPWFQPAPWGGGYMKEQFPHLPEDAPNYGWSYDIIAPENGITFQSHKTTLETSFDFLMYHNGSKLMGNHVHEQFDCEWPVRIDYLDTMDGGNLSIQCHPRKDYIQENFGERFTQDECYYIMNCKNKAKVFLGFQEDIDPEEFRAALLESQNKGTELDVDHYIQSLPAHKHDLFLIPAGTIHASGKDNLVLEISATTYNFTFKMYDWQRLDLDGKPRPINIERAFANLEFSRKGQYVEKNLVARPYCLQSGDNWQVMHLPTHSDHFYDVHRIEFSGQVKIEIVEDSFHVLTLAEGDSITVTSKNGLEYTLNYQETIIIPCAASSYTLSYYGHEEAKVIKTFVK